MTETSSVRTTGGTPVARVGRADGYKAVEGVRMRARLQAGMDDPRLKRALEKLDRFLKSGKPFRMDVPPGFYLDILV